VPAADTLTAQELSLHRTNAADGARQTPPAGLSDSLPWLQMLGAAACHALLRAQYATAVAKSKRRR
jgi:hypothetical protein